MNYYKTLKRSSQEGLSQEGLSQEDSSMLSALVSAQFPNIKRILAIHPMTVFRGREFSADPNVPLEGASISVLDENNRPGTIDCQKQPQGWEIYDTHFRKR